jgi:chitin synthase
MLFISFGLSTGSYFIAALAHGDLFSVASTFFQYLYMLPTFVNILMIFAFCNTHDLSWGTKGLDGTAQAHGKNGGINTRTYRSSLEGTQNFVIARLKQSYAQAMREKAQEAHRQECTASEFRGFRSFWVTCWVFTNTVYCATATSFFDGGCFLSCLAYLVAFINSIRLVAALLHVLRRGCKGAQRMCGLRRDMDGLR